MTPTVLSTPCREWQGARSKAGYGQRWRDGKLRYLHREIVEWVDGPLLPGQVVRHRCDNPPCFRYNHLVAGSQQENVDDMLAKGRAADQRRVDRDELVRRYLAGERSADLAVEFGVHQDTVAKYARRVDPEATRARHGRGRWR